MKRSAIEKLILFCVATWLLTAGPATMTAFAQEDELWETPPVNTDPQDSELTKLRKQKVNLAAQILRDGRLQGELICGDPHAVAQLRQAELELAATKDEKLAALAREEARLLSIEKVFLELARGGRSPFTDLQAITAMRIGNQIAQRMLRNQERPETISPETKKLIGDQQLEVEAILQANRILFESGLASSPFAYTPGPSLDRAHQTRNLEITREGLQSEIEALAAMRLEDARYNGRAPDKNFTADEDWAHAKLAQCELDLLQLAPARRDIARSQADLKSAFTSHSRAAWGKWLTMVDMGIFDESELIGNYAQIEVAAMKYAATSAQRRAAIDWRLQALAELEKLVRLHDKGESHLLLAKIEFSRTNAKIHLLELESAPPLSPQSPYSPPANRAPRVACCQRCTAPPPCPARCRQRTWRFRR